MADVFLDGMPNVNEELNKMQRAFAAGPYNALPLTGGALTGPVMNTSHYQGTRFIAGVDGSSWRSEMLITPRYGIAGLANNALILGVSEVQGISNNGNFTWSTAGGVGGDQFSTGYAMYLQATDTGSNATTDTLMSISGRGDLYVGRTTVVHDILPITDSAYTIGNAATRFQTMYAVTGTINTSDARLKCDFRDLTPAEIAAARDIARAIGIYRWRDAVDCKGDGAREHVGPTVQAAIEIMQAHGLDPFGYGFICYDAWEQQTVEHPAVEARAAVPAVEAAPAELDALGNLVTPAVPASPGYPAIKAHAAYTEVLLEAGDRYAFRYDELAMFIAAGQEARLAALETA